MLAFFLAFSRYGDLKLGDEDEEPEFSLGAWFAMLFSAGMGIGLVFWGVAEPISHYTNAPPGIAPGTPEAANAAMRYAFFHWGLHPWSIYGIVGLAIAFFQFRRKSSALVSSATEALPWKVVQRLSPAFNVLAVVATAFGMAASLGMGATQINSGMHVVFGVPVGVAAQAGIIAVTTALFLVSAVSGVGRGIKWLSSGNLVVAALLALTVLILGPTIAIVDTFTTTLGSYLSEFVRMSLRMSPFRDSSWIGDWTIFYWAWWISWSPFVGLFIARVSRGPHHSPVHHGHGIGTDAGGFCLVFHFWRHGSLYGDIPGRTPGRSRQGRCVHRHVCVVQCPAHGGGDVGGGHLAGAGVFCDFG